MTRFTLLTATLIVMIQTAIAHSETEWNGYIQTRFNSNIRTHSEFLIRRGKFWLQGPLPNVSNLSFKIQVVYCSVKDQSFKVQDAYARYQTSRHTLLAGYLVPDFTLQRNQPDAAMPVLERGLVIDGMIHGDRSIARLLGIQYRYDRAKQFYLGLGIFNANFNTPGRNTDNTFLYTMRSAYRFLNKRNFFWQAGASFAYRKLSHQTLPCIYDGTQPISGDDVRWGLEMLWRMHHLEIQGEYLTANIQRDHAWGYYLYGAYRFAKNMQSMIKIEKFNDLNPETLNNEYYRVGLNYYLTKQAKVMGEIIVQFSTEKNNYEAKLQFLIFFNS